MLSQKAVMEQSVYSGTDSGTGWSISTTEATALLNEAMQRLSVRCGLRDTKIALTLSAVNVYRMNDSAMVGAAVWRPLKVVINGLPLADASWREFGLWTLDEFERWYPKWRTETGTNQITAACYTGHGIGSGSGAGGGQLIFNQVPSAAMIALSNHYIDGYAYPHPMVYGTDSAKELKIPSYLHFACVDLALIIGESPNASEGEHWNRLDRMQGDLTDTLERFRKEEERAGSSWGSTRGNEGMDDIWF